MTSGVSNKIGFLSNPANSLSFLTYPNENLKVDKQESPVETNDEETRIRNARTIEQKENLEMAQGIIQRMREDEIEKAKKVLHVWAETYEQLWNIVNHPATEKNVLNDARISLAKLYLLHKDSKMFQNAIKLYKQVIDDVDADKNQVLEAKYQLALTLKKGGYPYFQEALTLFSNLLNCEFHNQDLVKINYVDIFIQLNKESNNTDYTFVLDLIDKLIDQFLQKPSINDAEKCILKEAYLLKAFLFTLKNPSYIHKIFSKDFIDPLFKAHILGYPEHEIQQCFPQLSMPKQNVDKIRIIRIYLDAAKDLKFINPELLWLSLFGNLSDFLEIFANLFKLKKDTKLTDSSASQLKEMCDILREYINNGMDLCGSYASPKIAKAMGEFCYNIILELERKKELKSMERFKKQITKGSDFFQKSKKIYEGLAVYMHRAHENSDSKEKNALKKQKIGN